MVGEAGLELEPLCGRERMREPAGEILSAVEGPAAMVGEAGLELEPLCGRERSGSPQAKS